MTEEENKAIEEFKRVIDFVSSGTGIVEIRKFDVHYYETILNLIEKLQNENEEYKLLNANIEKANRIIEGKEEYIPKSKIRKLEDMWNDNIWNATDSESEAKAEMIRDVYRGLLDE